jgi:stealth protein CR2/Stealth-like protein
MFAPFVRRVFLVTDDQVPDWLDDAHPQLRVVSHRELFDADDVPTFNSNAIDSRLHHIDGLAEHFLYTNDDIFFTAPAYPVDFFLGNGLARLFLSRATIPHGDVDPGEPNVDSCAKNQRRLLAERFGQTVTQKFKHIPVPQLRSARFEAEEMFSEVAARTAGNRFRHHTDVNYSHLSAYVAYFTGRAITGTLPYDYVYLVDAARVNALSDIAQAVKVLCLNDGDAASARDSRGRPITLSAADEQGRDAALRAFLEATYPRPSRFERREDEPSPLVLAPRSPADESAVQAPSRGTRQSLGGG